MSVLITNNPLNTKQFSDEVNSDENGAIVLFLGVTRNQTDDREVLYLEYEAYRPMADNKIHEVIDQTNHQFPISKISIGHRLGRLEIGEISLVVAVSAPHRQFAFEANQFIVDKIKQIVPIWKREFFVGGDIWVGYPEDIAQSAE